MDIDLPSQDDPRRLEVRRWFEEHPQPTASELVDIGYVTPHWPRPWGLDAEPELQLIIDDEMKRAGVSKPLNPIGIGHCGPVIVVHGSEEQQQRYLPPMLRGEELWCQLFSEPDAGSDLANLSTRAVRDGDVFIVNGQKIWTSLAMVAKFGILIARTDPDTSKYTGISYFIVPMDSPGIEIRPLRNMVGGFGDAGFCEVFFTNVEVPVENLIGSLNGGWAMAKETLANERVSLSREGLQWGYGPTVRDLVDLARADGGVDAITRQRLVSAYIDGEILRYHQLRQISAAVNKKPGPDASLRKALKDPHGKVGFGLGKDMMGAYGMLAPEAVDPKWEPWASGFLFSPALTVGGGTSEVLRNIIAERMLGLPHDTDVEAGLTWTEGRAPAPQIVTIVRWLDEPSDRELESVARVVNEFWREVIPDEPDRPAAELAAAIRNPPDHRTVSLAVAANDADIVGAAEVIFEGYEGRRHDGWLKYLVVRSDHRRRGVGRELLDAVIQRSRAHDVRRLKHTVAIAHTPGMAFAAAVGASPTLVDVQNRLRVAELDRGLLEAWVSRATERATNYSIVAFDGVCPDELLEQVAHVTAVMNDAPRSETESDVHINAEQVRQNMEAFARQGNVMWTICVRDDTSREFVGFTELAFGPYRPSLANQGDTAVHPAHRERGLGRWIKAVNTLRMLDERPEVTAIDTWNAGVNAAMLSINRAMGFRTLAEWQEWELSV